MKTNFLRSASLYLRVCSLAGILSLLTQADAASNPLAASTTKPNIIVIYTDDHGYADLGCQDIRKDLKTPNIDALAAAGVRMKAGYVTAPQCCPSRVGLISGQYQGKFGLDDNGSFKQDPTVLERFRSLPPLPMRLKRAGYATGMAGKSHLGSDDSAELVKLGFDKAFFKHSNGPGHWNMDLTGQDIAPQKQSAREYHLETITSFACTFIERFNKQPFFFYLAYRAPHVPLDAPEKYTSRFPGEMPEVRRKALGSIAAVDDGVGRVMETLRKNGLEENTLIFVISDNGAPIGRTTPGTRDDGAHWAGSINDPLNGGKGILTEGGIRIPFVVSWKGTIPGGQVYEHPVIALDVAATASSLAGLPHDPTLDGVNLLPFLTGKNSDRPHDVLYWRWNNQYAIRQGDLKYITAIDRQYLFDLSTDPGEQHNLAAQQPERAAQLRAKLGQWTQTLIPPGLELAEVKRSSRLYFDFYLGEKKQPDAEPVKPSIPETKSKRKARRDAAKAAEAKATPANQ